MDLHCKYLVDHVRSVLRAQKRVVLRFFIYNNKKDKMYVPLTLCLSGSVCVRVPPTFNVSVLNLGPSESNVDFVHWHYRFGRSFLDVYKNVVGLSHCIS